MNLHKIVTLGKSVSITGLYQLLIQGLGFVSGILIIRLLTPQQYGYYTLANTFVGTMNLLADSGISMGVMALGGKVWTDKAQLGRVLVTGIFLRKRFAIASLCLLLPVLGYLLYQHQANWLTIALISLSIIPAFFMALSGLIYEIAPKLHQDVARLQKIQLVLSIVRLSTLTLTIFVFPFAYIAILAAGLPQIWANLRLKKISSTYVDFEQEVDTDIERNILTTVKKVLPSSLYYCISGQISIWLISFFGSGTMGVAELGALGRFSMIFTVFSSICSILLYPKFAKLAQNKLVLTRYVVKILALEISLVVIILVTTYFLSNYLLWILGAGYVALKTELFLSVLAGCLSFVAATFYGLYTSRGWVLKPFYTIVLNILSVIIGVLLLDIRTTIGVLEFNIFTATVQLFIHLSYMGYRILR